MRAVFIQASTAKRISVRIVLLTRHLDIPPSITSDRALYVGDEILPLNFGTASRSGVVFWVSKSPQNRVVELLFMARVHNEHSS